jgi:muramoyltetrapeptide carboxypeptidase
MTFVRYPSPLSRGDTVFVTAPSSGVEPRLHARLELALDHLQAQGFRVEQGHCLREQHQDASASAQDRAAELMQALMRDDVAAILPPWGGELAVDLLDRLDWTELARAQPKWLMGYSDTTTWMLPIALRLRWAVVHGPCLMDLVSTQTDALTLRAFEAWRLATSESYTQASSVAWQREWTDFAAQPQVAYRLDQPTRVWSLNGATSIDITGRLMGGCMDTLTAIAGTPHAPMSTWLVDARARGGAIVFLENAEASPTAVVRMLRHLRWCGWFEGVAGVMLGRSAGPDAADATRLSHAQAVQRVLGDLPCPVLMDVDVGHLPPQWTLVLGAQARVRWTAASGTATIEQMLR